MSIRQLKERFEAVYRDALTAQEVDASQIIGRANALIQSYNDALQYARQAGADQLGVKELPEVSRRMEDFNIGLGYERVEQVAANVNKAMIALGFPIVEGVQLQAWAATPIVPSIQLNVIQQVNQLTNVSFDQLIEMIQQENVSKEMKEGATNAVKEFNDEIGKAKPELSKLKSCLDTVLKVGTKFGIPLLFRIVENWDKIFH